MLLLVVARYSFIDKHGALFLDRRLAGIIHSYSWKYSKMLCCKYTPGDYRTRSSASSKGVHFKCCHWNRHQRRSIRRDFWNTSRISWSIHEWFGTVHKLSVMFHYCWMFLVSIFVIILFISLASEEREAMMLAKSEQINVFLKFEIVQVTVYWRFRWKKFFANISYFSNFFSD